MFGIKRIGKGEIQVYISYLTVCLYYPKFYFRRWNMYGIIAKTIIAFRPKPKFHPFWSWAFVFQIIGFGFGLSWKHIENKRMIREAQTEQGD